jgi:hypothetical protein
LGGGKKYGNSLIIIPVLMQK